MNRTTKILGFILLSCLAFMMALILIEVAPTLISSVGWHDIARSVGWVG